MFNSDTDTQKFINEIRKVYYVLNGTLYKTFKSKETPHKSVGYFDKGCGYLRMKYKGKAWLVHRLIFILEHGHLPEFIDHINKIKVDNRVENLRACGYKGENTVNSKIRADNTSGYRGVTKVTNSKSWQASIFQKGRRQYLGSFADPKDAAKVYNIKAKELFGDFAELNNIEE